MDRAVRCTENEYQSRGWCLLLLNKAPQFDPLRGMHRFDAIVRRMKLPG